MDKWLNVSKVNVIKPVFIELAKCSHRYMATKINGYKDKWLHGYMDKCIFG